LPVSRSRHLAVYVLLSLMLLVTSARSDTLVLDTDLVLGDDENELIGVVTTVVEDSKGFLYLADVGFRYIQKYSATGELVGVFGKTGEGPGDPVGTLRSGPGAPGERDPAGAADGGRGR
jgi:hypothetical protein